MNPHKDDTYWMNLALREALKAEKQGEVPIGAVLVQDGQLISRAHNEPISKNDPTAHAEILCLRRAGKRLNNYRLGGTILYVTVEPCSMCAGAMLWARIDKVVYGCKDLRAGACGSVIDVPNVKEFNHRYKVQGGILENECRTILQNFFRNKR